MVYIIFGLPGSGKSFYAERLAAMVEAAYINTDRLRKSMFPQPQYTQEEKEAVYQAMRSVVETAIHGQRSIVVDGTFFRNAIRLEFAETVAGKDELVFIEVVADEGLIRERLNRKREYSDADMEVFSKIRNAWEEMKAPHLVLKSTNDNIDEMLAQTRAYLYNRQNPLFKV